MPQYNEQLSLSDSAIRRSRGRPELPEDERKARATFSITKKTLDRFYQVCEINHGDSNRIVEDFMARYIDEYGNIEIIRQRREELLKKLEENRKKLDDLAKKLPQGSSGD